MSRPCALRSDRSEPPARWVNGLMAPRLQPSAVTSLSAESQCGGPRRRGPSPGPQEQRSLRLKSPFAEGGEPRVRFRPLGSRTQEKRDIWGQRREPIS